MLPCDRRLMCENCCNPFGNEGSETTSFKNANKTLPNISEDEVQIIDAISYIYGIAVSDLLESTQLSRQEDNSEEVEIHQSIYFCESCILLLADNYAAHKTFELASHPASIMKKISLFHRQDNVISFQEKEIDCDPLFQENDLLDSFNFEDKYEAGIEQTEEIDIENKYEPDDSESFQQLQISTLQQEIPEEKPTYVTTLDSLGSKQPIVKLERLSKELLNTILNRPSLRKVSSKIEKGLKLKKTPGRKLNECIDSELNLDRSVSNGKGATEEKECDKKFKERQIYKRRRLPWQHENNPRVRCGICGKLVRKYKLKSHMKVRHISEEERENQKVVCEICGAKLSGVKSLKLHMRRQHSDPRQIYKCDKCDKEYLNKNSYETHTLWHFEQLKSFLCEVCGKAFFTEPDLRRHEKIHTEENIFSCHVCSKSFRNKTKLRIHLESHETQRKYKCNECGKTFKFQSHISLHAKLHKEIKEKGIGNVECDECGKVFKHSISLYRHKLKMHNKKKKIYKCSFCGKTLFSNCNLISHENLHKNNPNYQPRKKQTFKRKIEVRNHPSSNSIELNEKSQDKT